MITMLALVAAAFFQDRAEEMRGREISWTEAASLPTQVRGDFDGDGADDVARINVVPHSYRHDIDIVLAKAANRSVHIVAAHQPDKGALIHRGIRLLQPGRYAIACARADGRDTPECVKGIADVAMPGIEVFAPGGTRHLIWREGENFVAARAVEPDTDQMVGAQKAD
ncbi:hypothetical protein [Allosphingosinicella vermicomposti]|uniref:hypothetical protein n=1 Tax=Allosphingosinicella vermicomposti TaxID=614671 RepID=UPI000D0E37A5|nr:hypothetical protein [Allosphingosinicella vermicomposti]